MGNRDLMPVDSAPRLYLVTPPVADPAALAADLAAVVKAADIAAVLLRLAPADERTLVNRIKALAPAVQGAGAALILDGHPQLVARAGADGAHLTGLEEFETALATLKPERIVGCGGLASRDDAMTVAEHGADYVMFGEPEADGSRPAFEAIEDRLAWWAEVFQVPCVGYAASLDEMEALARTGAEFVALGDFVWRDPRGVAAAVAAATERLTAMEPAS